MSRYFSCVLALLVATTADAATFRVNDTADAVDAEPGDGVCASAASTCTLRAAVQEANALPGADRIRVAPGTYGLSRSGASEDDADSGDLDLRGALRVIGAGASATIIDGAKHDRVFDVLGKARITLARLTVRNGAVESLAEDGGGVRSGAKARLSLKRVVVAGNSAFEGGGVAAAGRAKISASTVRDNAAAVGGGVALGPGSEIRASTLTANLASGVGAFRGLDVLAHGPGTLTIVNSTITGQVETIAFCTPSAAGCSEGADVVLANVTANAVSRVSLGPPSGSFTLRNSIVEVCDADLISQGYNFIAQEGCFIEGDMSGVVMGDTPLLGSLADHGGPTTTRVPVAVSEAVDGGNPAPPGSGGNACEATDQRGVARPLGDRCDMGAVEAH